MGPACKVVINNGLAKISEETARMVEAGKFPAEVIAELHQLDVLYLDLTLLIHARFEGLSETLAKFRESALAMRQSIK